MQAVLVSGVAEAWARKGATWHSGATWHFKLFKLEDNTPMHAVFGGEGDIDLV